MWPKEGIKAFNEYGEIVRKAREKHPDFDEEYQEKWKKQLEYKNEKKRKMSNEDKEFKQEILEAFDDFNWIH